MVEAQPAQAPAGPGQGRRAGDHPGGGGAVRDQPEPALLADHRAAHDHHPRADRCHAVAHHPLPADRLPDPGPPGHPQQVDLDRTAGPRAQRRPRGLAPPPRPRAAEGADRHRRRRRPDHARRTRRRRRPRTAYDAAAPPRAAGADSPAGRRHRRDRRRGRRPEARTAAGQGTRTRARPARAHRLVLAALRPLQPRPAGAAGRGRRRALPGGRQPADLGRGHGLLGVGVDHPVRGRRGRRGPRDRRPGRVGRPLGRGLRRAVVELPAGARARLPPPHHRALHHPVDHGRGGQGPRRRDDRAGADAPGRRRRALHPRHRGRGRRHPGAAAVPARRRDRRRRGRPRAPRPPHRPPRRPRAEGAPPRVDPAAAGGPRPRRRWRRPRPGGSTCPGSGWPVSPSSWCSAQPWWASRPTATWATRWRATTSSPAAVPSRGSAPCSRPTASSAGSSASRGGSAASAWPT